MQPLVSVIIPAHNGELYLREAIESVLGQTYTHHELWVIDNASSDHTKKIIADYPKANYFYTDIANTALARHTGVCLSRGDYIAFLDQDDCWVREKLKKQIDFLESHSAMGAVIGWQQLFLQSGCEKPHWLKKEWLGKPQMGYLPSALMVRRDTFNVVNNFDVQFALASDVAWFFKAKQCGVKIGVLDEVVVNRRIHGQNTSTCYSALHREILKIIHATLMENRKSPLSLTGKS